jgi:uncharacterized protein
VHRLPRGWLAAVALALCLVPARALDLGKLKPQGYVSDFAGVVDATSKTQIDRYCADVQHATGVQMALVTLDTLDGNPIEDVANELFHQWGVGQKGKDNGVMLMLVIHDHQDRIEVGYGLEPILTDGFVGNILDEMRPSLKQSNYAQAMMAGAAAMGQQIAQAKGVTIQRTLPRRAPPRRSGGGIPWTLVIFIIIMVFGLFGRGGGRGFLVGMLLGNLLGGGRYGGGGWGGGGFGGGGGGGGFGGFGGGDSGGGGASSGW